jgi:hypothetical protein
MRMEGMRGQGKRLSFRFRVRTRGTLILPEVSQRPHLTEIPSEEKMCWMATGAPANFFDATSFPQSVL